MIADTDLFLCIRQIYTTISLALRELLLSQTLLLLHNSEECHTLIATHEKTYQHATHSEWDNHVMEDLYHIKLILNAQVDRVHNILIKDITLPCRDTNLNNKIILLLFSLTFYLSRFTAYKLFLIVIIVVSNLSIDDMFIAINFVNI